MQDITESKLYQGLCKKNQRIIDDSVIFVNKLWAEDRLIKNYTDHGLIHSIRILSYIELFPHVVEKGFLQEDESFILILSVLLHDIGMQCDLRIHKGVQQILLENYHCEFAFNLPTEDFSEESQDELRKNHHVVGAAWIEYAYSSNENSDLHDAIKNISEHLITDLIEICMYHSKLNIVNCSERFLYYGFYKKRLLASLLRIGDELDISEDRVLYATVSNFSIPREHSIFWYLHNNTVVTVNKNGIIDILISLHPEDYSVYQNEFETYIKKLFDKNRSILNVLHKNSIPLNFNENEAHVISDRNSKKIPEDVMSLFFNHNDDEKVKKNEDVLLWRYIKHEFAHMFASLRMENDYMQKTHDREHTEETIRKMGQIIKSEKVIIDTLGIVFESFLITCSPIPHKVSSPSELKDIMPSIYSAINLLSDPFANKNIKVITDLSDKVIKDSIYDIRLVVYNILQFCLCYAYSNTIIHMQIKQDKEQTICIHASYHGYSTNLDDVTDDLSGNGAWFSRKMLIGILNWYGAEIKVETRLVCEYNLPIAYILSQKAELHDYVDHGIMQKLCVLISDLYKSGIVNNTITSEYSTSVYTPLQYSRTINQPTYSNFIKIKLPLKPDLKKKL